MKEEREKRIKLLPILDPYTIPTNVLDMVKNVVEQSHQNIYDYGTNAEKREIEEKQSIIASRYQKIDYNNPTTTIFYYEYSDCIAYLLFYFYKNFTRIGYILENLLKYTTYETIDKPKIKLLDVGTGPGTIPFSFCEYIASLLSNNYLEFEKVEIEIDTIESNSHFCKIYNSMIQNYDYSEQLSVKFNPPIHLKIKDSSREFNEFITSHNEEYDFIVFSNFFIENVLRDIQIKSIILKFMRLLNKDKYLIITEPGGTEPGEMLSKIRNWLINHVISPCLNVWEDKIYNCNDVCWFEGRKLIVRNELFTHHFQTPDGIPHYSYLAFKKSESKQTTKPKNNIKPISEINVETDNIINIVGRINNKGYDSFLNKKYLWICDNTQECKIIIPKGEAFAQWNTVKQNQIVELLNCQISPESKKYYWKHTRKRAVLEVDSKTTFDPWNFVYPIEKGD